MQPTSIVIVSHGHETDVQRLLDSLVTFFKCEFEVVLIDNLNNGLFFKDWILAYPFKITLVRNMKRYSFSRNNNMGVSISTFDNILLLNPDTWLENDSLQHWILAGKGDANTLHYPRLLNMDDTNQIHCKSKPSFPNQLMTVFWALLGKKRPPKTGDYWCFAAAVFFERMLFIRMGGFDEVFPLYCEDVELCDRARKMGIAIRVVDEVQIKHRLNDNSKNKYLKNAIFSNLYYRVKSLYNTFNCKK